MVFDFRAVDPVDGGGRPICQKLFCVRVCLFILMLDFFSDSWLWNTVKDGEEEIESKRRGTQCQV